MPGIAKERLFKRRLVETLEIGFPEGRHAGKEPPEPLALPRPDPDSAGRIEARSKKPAPTGRLGDLDNPRERTGMGGGGEETRPRHSRLAKDLANGARHLLRKKVASLVDREPSF